MKKGNFVVEYTTKDLMDKLNSIDDRIAQVHEQACLTNGKVKIHTKLIWGAFGFTGMVLGIVIALNV